MTSKESPSFAGTCGAIEGGWNLRMKSFMVGTAEYDDYQQMATNPPRGTMVIGKGEAAALSLGQAK